MSLFNRKSQSERLLEKVNASLEVATRIKSELPSGAEVGKALSGVVPKGTALKAGLLAGGLAGLTAGSAAVSSLRTRKEGARDDS